MSKGKVTECERNESTGILQRRLISASLTLLLPYMVTDDWRERERGGGVVYCLKAEEV